MVFLHLLPWFNRNTHGYAVNRRTTKILLSSKRKGWFLRILVMLSIMAIIPLLFLRINITDLKIDNFNEINNRNEAELKNTNIDETKRKDDDDTKVNRLVSQKIRLAAPRTYNLATIRNRHFAALKHKDLAAPNLVMPPTVFEFMEKVSPKIKKIAKFKAKKFPRSNTKLKYIL